MNNGDLIGLKHQRDGDLMRYCMEYEWNMME